ncbi:MAG: HAMP domain-containing histidine kinase [Lachnospiraceae bacterium]|nr:HAMP domain-containing histidine kinase [Lachnospiraceae bacterium]
MKKSLYYSFILAYVLIFICSFLIIDLWTDSQNRTLLIKNQAKYLYDSLNDISDNISPKNMELDEFDNSSEFDYTKEQLNLLSQVLDSTIQVIDYSGNIIYSTSFSNTKEIKYFDITDFGNNYYTTGHFYNYFDEEMLSVALPVTSNFKTTGYYLIHYKISNINDIHLSMQNIVYITCLFIFLLTLIILLMFTFIVFIPVKKISTAALEYAKGNFTYEGLSEFTSDNEIGRLGMSLNFMAKELNMIKSDENKFIANISHDFRSPLTSIKGYAEAMKDGTIPSEMQDKYFDIILFETERLTKLTENLLALNNWDSRGIHLDITEFNIYTLIHQNIRSFERKCEKKKIRFNLITKSKYYTVSADKDKISRVIYNLIDNAIKFSPNDSVITITISSKGEKVFVSVKDTGIGIPKDSLSKIWERFYKTDLSRGKDKTGSGLGLAISKEIINVHNENINVISTEGVGTEFIFTLKKALDA